MEVVEDFGTIDAGIFGVGTLDTGAVNVGVDLVRTLDGVGDGGLDGRILIVDIIAISAILRSTNPNTLI